LFLLSVAKLILFGQKEATIICHFAHPFSADDLLYGGCRYGRERREAKQGGANEGEEAGLQHCCSIEDREAERGGGEPEGRREAESRRAGGTERQGRPLGA